MKPGNTYAWIAGGFLWALFVAALLLLGRGL